METTNTATETEIKKTKTSKSSKKTKTPKEENTIQETIITEDLQESSKENEKNN